MGCDIHSHAHKRDADGNWVEVRGKFYADDDQPFSWRSYSVFAFLADVRNYSAVKPLSEPRGLPDDIDKEEYDTFTYGDHSFSWLSLDELLAVDYDQVIEDRRAFSTRVTRQITPNSSDGRCTADEGGGEKMSLREFLGSSFFNDLAELQRIGAERVVFGFDN